MQGTIFLSMQAGVCIDDNDARKMFNDYDVSVQPLIGLSIIANVKLAGPHRRWSLAALTEMITCKEVISIAHKSAFFAHKSSGRYSCLCFMYHTNVWLAK
jgi:predicted nucleic acid-binding protein